MLAACLEGFDAPPTTTDSAQSTGHTSLQLSTTPHTHFRFAPPKSQSQIDEARLDRIPTKTKDDTTYCHKLWKTWRECRQTQTGENIPSIETMTHTELTHWLSRFVVEVRKVDGTEYPPNTLHHIVAGLQNHLRLEGKMVDLFKDRQFAPFQASLDGEMKRLQACGLGAKKRQAEVITHEEEEKLWESGQLGDSTPQQLLDTIVFCCGLFFALRSSKEHRQLCRTPPQIELIERPGERAYLRYREDVSKNHPGGLKARNIPSKVVYHHANLENPQRCFVRLYKKYLALSPADAPADAFYLKPARSPTSSCWFSRNPLGHNPLGGTVARICRLAGIPRYKTNRSLRATSASRLYQSGVDEQLVMERTGHQSLTGVRSYKRTSDEQRVALSDIMNCATKRDPAASTSNDDKTFTLTDSVQLSHASFSGCTVNFYVGKRE